MSARFGPWSSRLALSLAVFLLASPSLAFSMSPSSPGSHTGLTDWKASAYSQLVSGSRLADHNEFESALPYFEQAVEKNPTSVIAHFNLAYTLMGLADSTSDTEKQQSLRARAEWEFQRVRDLNPDLASSYYKLGKLATLRQDYDSACAYYESGLEVLPENFALWFNLAATAEKQNRPERAEKAYLKAINANPEFVYAYNNLALLYENQGQGAKAEALYRVALQVDPTYNFARLNLGSLLQGQGRLDEAMALYQQAVSFEPDNAWAFLYLGNAHYRGGNYEQALNAYNRAIELNPEYATAYYLVSLTLNKLNRRQEALVKSLQYLSMAPDGTFVSEASQLVEALQRQERARTASQYP